MTIGDPDWDVAKATRDMLRNARNTGGTDFGDATGVATVPDSRVVLSNTEAGKGVDYTQEYVLVSETGERGFEWADLILESYNADAVAFVELATPESRGRREELWEETLEIVKANRKRSAGSGTPGSWDTLSVESAPVNDDAFNWWAMEVTFIYEADSRKV